MLELGLAANARVRIRDGHQPGPRDGLAALRADAVGSGPHPLERGREPARPVREPAGVEVLALAVLDDLGRVEEVAAGVLGDDGSVLAPELRGDVRELGRNPPLDRRQIHATDRPARCWVSRVANAGQGSPCRASSSLHGRLRRATPFHAFPPWALTVVGGTIGRQRRRRFRHGRERDLKVSSLRSPPRTHGFRRAAAAPPHGDATFSGRPSWRAPRPSLSGRRGCGAAPDRPNYGFGTTVEMWISLGWAKDGRRRYLTAPSVSPRVMYRCTSRESTKTGADASRLRAPASPQKVDWEPK